MFSYDLGELGRYYRAYQRLMAHWRRVLPAGVMIEVDYEAVIEDLPGEIGRLLTQCGLAWDPACSNFAATRRVVRTASAVQVRRPLYREAIGRAKPYLPHLGPLLAGLAL